MDTHNVGQTAATSQIENAAPAAPQLPPPPPENPPAVAAAGHAGADSQGNHSNGTAAAPSARRGYFWPNLPPPGHPPLPTLEERIQNARSAVVTARTGHERSEAKQRLKALEAETDGLRFLDERIGDSIQARAIDWLWEGWIPQGYITIMAGETGAGKGTVLADLAARVTTGAPWPDQDDKRDQGRVLWLGSEDSHEEMTIPRLKAASAELRRVSFIGIKTVNGCATFSLQDDIGRVRDRLTQTRTRENDEPFTMMIIDPVTSYLAGGRLRKVDMNDAGQLRSILEPWMAVAQEHRLAIVCVTHFSKDTTRSMLHRVLGSQAFAATCRSLIAITALKDQDDPHAKAMFQVKTNLPERPEGAWRLSTVKTWIGTDALNGKSINATRVEWDTMDDALTPENVMGLGQERGPLSQYAVMFPVWLKAQFVNLPPERGMPVSELKRKALSDRVATASWWEKHSAMYLDKWNIGGVWQCRPLNETLQGGG